MANLEVIYKKSYLRGKKAYTGNFPITVIGPLGCVTAEQIAENKAYIQHILSEDPDKISEYGAGYLSLDGRYELLTFEGGSIIPFKEIDLTRARIVLQSLQDGNYTSTQTLSVSSIGIGVLSYQWYKNGEIITGATSNSIEVSANGEYYCQSKNSLATSDSKVCSITFEPELASLIPSSGNYTNTQTLSVGAAGVGTLSYQWFINGFQINNATSLSLDVSSNGVYFCRVTNPNGDTFSSDISATFKPEAVIQPDLATISVSSYLITVSAAAVGSLSYQWYKDNNSLPETDNNTLTITDSGVYYCVVTNLNGSTISNSMTATFL